MVGIGSNRERTSKGELGFRVHFAFQLGVQFLTGFGRKPGDWYIGLNIPALALLAALWIR
jgi:hypothetical protein